ncbi:hypothetical protein QCB08_000960 [Salmonella enterica]|nr:hypothetical protein [Salmonella enterica]
MMTTLLPDFTASSSFTFFSSERTGIAGSLCGHFFLSFISRMETSVERARRIL